MYDPVISLLGIYPGGMKILGQRLVSTWKFTAVLHITAKKWKPKCPSTGE